MRHGLANGRFVRARLTGPGMLRRGIRGEGQGSTRGINAYEKGPRWDGWMDGWVRER